ncbi:MAG TPA: aminotransferase class I/II-fold pyridoxal phosphate-dependent enzyme [Jatrophihabitantaceae bacterium]
MTHPYDDLDLAELRRRRSVKWTKFGPDVLPLFVAEMDFPLAEPIRRVLHELIDRGDTGYPVGTAHEEAFRRFAERRYGWRPDTAAVVTVPDVMTGVEFAIGQLTQPGDPVAFFIPAYPPFFVAVESTRRAVAGVPLARDAEVGATIDGDALATTLREGAKAILLCNPHNPTGRVFTRDELTTVASLADRYGVPVISDEIHAPLVLDRAATPHIPFATLDAEAAARGVCLHSASKGWNVPGLKAAVLITGSSDVRKSFDTAALDELSERAGIAGVVAGAAAFDEGEPWLDDTVVYIEANHRLVHEAVPTALPGARVTRAEATYLAWLDLRGVEALDDGEPADSLLDRAGVALVPGPSFGARYGGWARMNVATSAPIIREAIARMAAAVR